MALLAFLGFTDFSRSLPLNDKLLHFLCFTVATGVFYFIFDVEEDARRIWFWRHSGLIFTAIVCFFFGGLVSEFVQSMLPYKEFQFGDVVANLSGSSIGLYTSYHLERYYRYRREIARLYTPLAATFSDSEDDVDDTSTPLLPMTHHHNSQSRTNKSTRQPKLARLANVWDEREELFGLGRDSDEEEDGVGPHPSPPLPKIHVTEP
jgi:VanZ family protein